MVKATSSLVKYMAAEMKAGFGESQIRKALRSSGYSKKDIDEAFQNLESYSHKKHILVFLISSIVFVCIVVLIMFLITTTQTFNECKEMKGVPLINCEDNAYYKNAVKTKNSRLCNKIVDNEKKENCYMEFGILTGKRKEHFDRVITQAIESRSPLVCRQFDKESIRLRCSDELYLYRAKKENNPSLCQFLVFAENRRECQ